MKITIDIDKKYDVLLREAGMEMNRTPKEFVIYLVVDSLKEYKLFKKGK